VDRARAVAPDFETGAAQLACVAEIVRRLDGLPLAIELAAARLHTHELEEVATGLDHRFALLSSGFRVSSRHGSLGAAVSWSYDLLDPDLQRTFADLSVFAGSFDAVGAAAVCGSDPRAAADALARLVERSLVMRVPGRRYMLLETLRAFGAEELERAGRSDVVAERHARHLVEWVEVSCRRLVEPDEVVLTEMDAAVPELRCALAWLLRHEEIELAGRLVSRLLHFAFLRLRPDVLSWAEPVAASDPQDRSPLAARVWATVSYAAWMAGDVAESGELAARALRLAESAGAGIPPDVLAAWASFELFEGRLDEAAAWYRRSVEASTADPGQRLLSAASEVLALAYAGRPEAADRADALLAEVVDRPSPVASYVWYCAGEADLAVDVERARARYSEALRLAELTHASFVTGLAGASKVSIDARVGDPAAAAEDYRRLIDHWRRAGMWSTQWTMLRSIAGLLFRLGRHRDAAVLEGAVRATAAGHRIFGADAAALDRLSAQLRAELGDDDYESARQAGAMLDGDGAVEHALRAL
jgi:tetratricopeptide (TPR) repeat protein